MSRVRRAAGAASTAWVIGGEIVGLLAQIALIVTGYGFVIVEDEQVDDEIGRLLLWCLIGTLYVLAMMLWLNVSVRIRDVDHPVLIKILDSGVVRWLSSIFTFLTSLMGLTAAVTLIVIRGGERAGWELYEFAAVWAMLISWAIFHWGYARIYHAKFYRAKGQGLAFPETPVPRLVDFVYFSFTIGTSFAPSDVAVTTSRMRWSVLWHTVYSFFFNALIIVLTMNTILGS